MSTGSIAFIREFVQGGLDLEVPTDILELNQPESLDSAFPVSDLATASFATFALAIRKFQTANGHPKSSFSIDRRLASNWFDQSYEPISWSAAPAWDAIAGNYQARDGWIRLHTNAPAHRMVVERLLGVGPNRDDVARTVAKWESEELERSIVEAGGCAAKLWSAKEWYRHPHGIYSKDQRIIESFEGAPWKGAPWTADHGRPLKGIRVLDLTRILAGPVATRALASLGAEVLRIDPIEWHEPSLEPDVTLGKRCARLNLKSFSDQNLFRQLLQETDVLVSGYRPGALDSLGFGWEERQVIKPGLVDVTLNAYGWYGPWSTRRGFDSLVQMSTGIVDRCSDQSSSSLRALPVQALDHATGYIMAAAVLEGLSRRLESGQGSFARTSLVSQAEVLKRIGTSTLKDLPPTLTEGDWQENIEISSFGPMKRLRFPIQQDAIDFGWDSPAVPLGTSKPEWHRL